MDETLMSKEAAGFLSASLHLWTPAGVQNRCRNIQNRCRNVQNRCRNVQNRCRNVQNICSSVVVGRFSVFRSLRLRTVCLDAELFSLIISPSKFNKDAKMALMV